MDPMVWDVLKTCISCGLSFALGLVASLLARRRAQEDKIIEEQKHQDKAMVDKQIAGNIGLLALIRKSLVDSYERHVTLKVPMTIERRHEIDQMYAAYKTLGGNGTITHLYEELSECPTEIVGGGD